MTFPWAQHYDPGVPLTVGPVNTSLPRLLLQAAEQSPQAPALVFFGRTTTYGELNTQTAGLASALKDLGLAPGDRLGIFLPNCPQLVMAYHAALSLGAVAVMLNPLLSPKELAHQLADSGAQRLVLLDHFLPRLEEIRGPGRSDPHHHHQSDGGSPLAPVLALSLQSPAGRPGHGFRAGAEPLLLSGSC